MEVDDECFAFTRQGFAHTKRLDPNFQTNAGAPSGLTSNWLGGHTQGRGRRISSMPLCSDCRLLLKKLPPGVGAFLRTFGATQNWVRQSEERVCQ